MMNPWNPWSVVSDGFGTRKTDYRNWLSHMDVSENSGFSPKSSILIGVSIINHSFWDTTIFGNTHIKKYDR